MRASRRERNRAILAAAADPANWRSVGAYAAAPVFLAVITDWVIAVIRQHILQ